MDYSHSHGSRLEHRQSGQCSTRHGTKKVHRVQTSHNLTSVVLTQGEERNQSSERDRKWEISFIVGNSIIIYHREHWYWLVNKCLWSQAFLEDLYSSLVFNVLDKQATFATRHLIILSCMCDTVYQPLLTYSETTITLSKNLIWMLTKNVICWIAHISSWIISDISTDHGKILKTWTYHHHLLLKFKEIHSGMNTAWVNVLKKYTEWNMVFGAQVGMSQP